MSSYGGCLKRRETTVAEKKRYEFQRKHPDGRISTLTGFIADADTPEAAMRQLKLFMGYTAEQGWFAVEMTDE